MTNTPWEVHSVRGELLDDERLLGRCTLFEGRCWMMKAANLGNDYCGESCSSN